MLQPLPLRRSRITRPPWVSAYDRAPSSSSAPSLRRSLGSVSAAHCGRRSALLLPLCASGRCTNLFSVNCVFITVVVLVLAIFIPLLMPAPNQAIINACKARDYKRVHALVQQQLVDSEADMRQRPAHWKGRKEAQVDDIDFGVRNCMHIQRATAAAGRELLSRRLFLALLLPSALARFTVCSRAVADRFTSARCTATRLS